MSIPFLSHLEIIWRYLESLLSYYFHFIDVYMSDYYEIIMRLLSHYFDLLTIKLHKKRVKFKIMKAISSLMLYLRVILYIVNPLCLLCSKSRPYIILKHCPIFEGNLWRYFSSCPSALFK